MARVLLMGGTGFIGGHVAARLAADGHALRVPTRRRTRARRLALLPAIDIVESDIHDPASLDALMTGVDVVVNLVGVLHSPSGHPYGPAFARAHVTLPERVLAAMEKAGVKRLVHMSALGAAPDAPSEYLRSKAAGEERVVAARNRVDATVLRPSVVFGPDDRFLNLFARLMFISPALFLGCAQAKFQPVYVGDVAECVARCIADPATVHHAYKLCGPRVYTLRELVQFAGRASGHPRPVIGLPDGLAYLQALSLECLPVKLLSRDNLRSMRVPSVCDCEFPFGILPASLESTAPAWLSRGGPYDGFRGTARRL